MQPDIDPKFSGYPNLPETPYNIKERRKISNQAALKQILDLQVASKREQ
jgi:hypothetical protein